MRALAYVLLLCLAAMPAAASGPWGDLSPWIGKYPTDDAKPKPHRLLETPSIAGALHRLLTPNDLALLNRFEVESTVSSIAGLVVVRQCMPHDCGSQHAMIVVDPAQPRLYAGFFAATGGRVVTRWIGTDDYARLPQAVLAAFDPPN